MVHLQLISHRGNTARIFPHTGYLGLTPVRVEGVVRTKLDEDGKPLLASSLVASVRCIESRLSRVGVVTSRVVVEYSQTLWTKPEGVEWDELGDSEHFFKIVVPAKSPGFSSVHFPDYRVHWRVDAVIEHTPIFAVGSRQFKSFDLPLVRYDTTAPRLPSPVSHFVHPSGPRGSSIRYVLTSPPAAVGPQDIVSLPVTIQSVDPEVSVQGASVVVVRRIELRETTGVPSPSGSRQDSPSLGSGAELSEKHMSTPGDRSRSSTPPPYIPPPVSFPSGTASSSTTLNSNVSMDTFSTAADRRPLLQPIVTNIPAKTLTKTIAGMERSGPFQRNVDGSYTKTLTFQWPAAKSSSQWAMGVTMQTDLITVRFFAQVKVIITSSSGITDTVDLEEREITVIPTNHSERKVAYTKYTETYSRSKSKSPRPSNSSRSSKHPPSPPLTPAVPPVPSSYSMQPSTSADHASGSGNSSRYKIFDFTRSRPPSSSESSTVSAPSSLRRPHTSSGPRGNAHGNHDEHGVPAQNHESASQYFTPFTSNDHNRSHTQPSSATKRPKSGGDSSNGSVKHFKSFAGFGVSVGSRGRHRERERECDTAKPQVLKSDWNANTNVPAVPVRSAADPPSVQAWEEELQRIELESRRSTAGMLGFKRSARSHAPAAPTLTVSLRS